MKTLALQLQGYLDHLTIERGVAANTLSSYRRDLRRYSKHLEERGITDLAKVGEHDVSEFLVALRRGDPDSGTAALSAPSTGVEAGFRAGLGAPGRGTSSTTQLPTTIHSFHSFIHSGKNPTNGVNTGSIRQPGPQLWITAPVNAFSSTAWQVPERNGLSH